MSDDFPFVALGIGVTILLAVAIGLVVYHAWERGMSRRRLPRRLLALHVAVVTVGLTTSFVVRRFMATSTWAWPVCYLFAAWSFVMLWSLMRCSLGDALLIAAAFIGIGHIIWGL